MRISDWSSDVCSSDLDGWRALWVVDWPMFERDDEAGRWVSLHHPFTAPKPFDADALRADPGATLSQGYDIVLNGVEVGGGSVRIHRPDVQQAVFDLQIGRAHV